MIINLFLFQNDWLDNMSDTISFRTIAVEDTEAVEKDMLKENSTSSPSQVRLSLEHQLYNDIPRVQLTSAPD